MYCRKCGKEMEQSHLFCKYCGTPVRQKQESSEVKPAPSYVKQSPSYVEQESVNLKQATSNAKPVKNSTLMPIIIIASVVLVIVVIAAIVISIILGNKSDKNDPKPSTVEQTMESASDTNDAAVASTEATTEVAYDNTVSDEGSAESTGAYSSLEEFEATLPRVSLDGMSYRHEREDYIYHGYPLENATGVFKTKTVDLDNDGENELLAFDISQYDGAESVCSRICMKVYEFDGGNVVQSADAIVAASIYDGAEDVSQFRIVLKDNHYICIDHTYAVYLEADGGVVDMQLWEYNGSELSMNGQLTAAGSDWYESTKYVTDIKAQLKAAGLNKTVQQAYKYGIYSFSMADPGMDAICKITAQVDTDDIFADGVSTVNTILHFIDENPESDYFFADSAYNDVDRSKLSTMSADQLRKARNEMFARYGWVFQDESLQEYFEGKAWYIAPYCGYENPNLKILNETEKCNSDTIKEYE